MSSLKEFQLIGCLGRHGPYTFFRSIKIGSRTLSLTSFFPVRPWPDSAMLSVAEVQLLWTDKTEGFCSLKLYFLPENTPEGRRQQHGEDEVIALQDKVIIRSVDLPSWLVNDADWDWGFVTPETCQLTPNVSALTKSFISDKFQKKDRTYDFTEPGSSRVVVLNYERYIRLRSVLKRLEGSPEMSNWLTHPLVLALGNINVGPGCKVLFTKEVFEYPELEDHELLCNHLAPKLKGRPRKKGRKRNPSLGSESNESEISSSGSTKSDPLSKGVDGVMLTEVTKPEDPKSPTIAIEQVTPAKSPEKPEEMEVKNSTKIDGVVLPKSNGLQVLKVQSDVTIKNGKRISDVACQGKNAVSIVAVSSDGRPLSKENVPEDPEVKKITAEILGPDLTKLAEKLEKSNAIKILPVRSSVITKMDSNSDLDIPNKTDNNSPTITAKTVTITNAAQTWSNGNGKNTSRIEWSKHPQPQQQQQQMPRGFIPKLSDRAKKILAPPPSQLDMSKDRPEVTITPFDSLEYRWRKIYAAPNPSPFAPSKTQVYGDPNIGSKLALQRGSGKTSHPEQPDKCLNLCVKRARMSNDAPRPSNPPILNVKALNGESELLDLSFRAQACGKNFKSISEIPAPNAMNQMGVRLTSEVTLYPAGSNQGSSANKFRFNTGPGVRAPLPNAPVKLPAMNSGSRERLPEPTRDPNGYRPGPSQPQLGMRNGTAIPDRVPPKSANVWRPDPAALRQGQSTTSSNMGNMNQQPQQPRPNQQARIPDNYNAFNQIERLPQPGHVHGTAAKPVASKGSQRQNEDSRGAREAEIQKFREQSALLTPSQKALNPFLSLQGMDPLYMSLMNTQFLNQYVQPPAANLEDWQRYQEMMRTWPFRTHDAK